MLVLWWAAHHRDHHRYTDQPGDLHSPRREGFWYSHIGWIFNGTKATNFDRIKDFAKFPELVWLNTHERKVIWLLGTLTALFFGWSGLFVGFFVSTLLVWHVTFCINSLAHVFGSQPFVTGDDSRNNPILAILAMGEGWHNNHHYHQSSVRQGFRWWQFDSTYWLLRLLAAVGLVWDLKEPPAALTRGWSIAAP